MRNSSLENIRLPVSSLAVIIDLATCTGFAFWPVVSPIRNLFVKYSFCLSENLALLVWVSLRAQPICNPDCRAGASALMVSSPNCGTLANWPSSLAAYPRTALSSMVSLSSARTCLPQSKCLCSAENLWYDFVQPSSGHAYSSLLSEERLAGGGSSLALFKGIEVGAFLDLTAENWSHNSLSEETADNRAIWKLAGMFIFDSGIFFPGPIPYAFHTRMYVLPYSTFATVLTPSSFTCPAGLGGTTRSQRETLRPGTPPEDCIASTIWLAVSTSWPSFK